MDNQNNSNFSDNTPKPASPFGIPPEPASDLNTTATGSAAGPAFAWPQTPLSSNIAATTPTHEDSSSTWTPPVQISQPSQSSPVSLGISNTPTRPADSSYPSAAPTTPPSTTSWSTQSTPDNQTSFPNPVGQPSSTLPTTNIPPYTESLASPQSAATNTWAPTVQDQQVSEAPLSSSTSAVSELSTQAPSPAGTESTFYNSPSSQPSNLANPPSLSPLDNPWGSPLQPPSIDGSQSTTQPSWTGVGPATTDAQNPNTPSTTPETAPTDLSHLISNDSLGSSQSAPETLVVPSPTSQVPDVPTVTAQTHTPIPVWLIGLGAGLLILVLAASAYFILGIGQSLKSTTSLPATTVSQTSQIKPPAPITIATPLATPKPPEQPATNNSGSFGQLEGNKNQATSAADLLQNGQQP